MIKKFFGKFSGEDLKQRAMRGTAASVSANVASQFIRFASNIILTRLLFPEAFGLMALAQVILSGVSLATTVGLNVSVMQNPRGDEPDFLNTIWTIQVIRGIFVWLVVCLLAGPVAEFYEAPELAWILPVAGLSLVVQGFHPTRILTHRRHLRLGRIAAVSVSGHIIHVVIMTFLAWWLQSVWALAIGMALQPVLMIILFHRFLEGIPNRFRLERESIREIFKLGKYLMVSTIATYFLNQSDRAILGKLISLDLLGVYSIGYGLANIAMHLSKKVSQSVVFPLYRMRHPADHPSNQAKIFRARRIVAASSLGLLGILAFSAPYLVEFVYDDRYILAGPVTVLMATAFVPTVVLAGLMNAALAKGDSLRFMLLNVASAATQVTVMYIAASEYGIPGAAIGVLAAPLLTYPLLVLFLRKYKNWDPAGDIVLLAFGVGITYTACRFHWDAITALLS